MSNVFPRNIYYFSKKIDQPYKNLEYGLVLEKAPLGVIVTLNSWYYTSQHLDPIRFNNLSFVYATSLKEFRVFMTKWMEVFRSRVERWERFLNDPRDQLNIWFKEDDIPFRYIQYGFFQSIYSIIVL